MSYYKPDYEGLGRLLVSPEMQEAMRRMAENVKERAEASAPVDESSGHPGRYKASFHVSSGVQEGRNKAGETTRRAYGQISNDAPEALFVEYGTKHNPAHRTLGKALIEPQE